jgi:hypothetical protein
MASARYGEARAGARPAGALLIVLALGLLLAACSPEAGRVRSGGPGADVGNRSPIVDIHGVKQPFYRTPAVGEGIRKLSGTVPSAPSKGSGY